MRRAIAVGLLASAVAAAGTASQLGSVINSFPARIYGHGREMMAVGMAYAFNDIWVMYYEGVLARRSYSTGSVIATYEMGTGRLFGLAFDGSYFWAAHNPSLYSTELYKINPPTMSIVASYVVNHNYGLRHFTWDGSCFWVNFIEDKYYAHRMSNTGSILHTFSIPYIYWAGVAYAGNIPDGPRLFEGAWATSPREVYVFEMPGRTFHYKFTCRIPELFTDVGCWDGTYLWTFGNWSPSGKEYCYQIIAWEPGIGITPASLGKVKALFR